MSSRACLRILLLITAVVSARAAELPAVHYTLGFPDATHHYVEVTADLPTDQQAELTVFMPTWTPGSYVIREYSRNLDSISAAAPDGRALAIEKTAKNRWRIATGGQPRVRVRYRLYAREIDLHCNWVEHDFAFLNGAATYLTLVKDYQRPYTVTVDLPKGWAGVYTPLAPGAEPRVFTAPDFDTLVDSPMLAGSPQVNQFEVDGVAHYLVTLGGGGIWDNARAARNLVPLVHAERDFWGGLPYREPYYFFNLLIGRRNGLEHKHSLVITADRSLSLTRGGIGSWLSLISHEYFHAWNGKRLRPRALGPFDYEHENYTHSLWVVEGLTNYYQQLMLLRAGVLTDQDFLNSISSQIVSLQNTPGRLVQSLSAASFDAWIKAYRPDANSANTRVSYYTGGAVAGLLLDAKIRQATNGAKSLNDVMRAAYERYSGAHGYTQAQFLDLVSQVAGADLHSWCEHLVEQPHEYDYQPMLDWYGLEFTPAAAPSPHLLPNRLEPADTIPGWLGIDTRDDNGRLIVNTVRQGTPAYDAGLDPDDEILSANGLRVLNNGLDKLVSNLPVGATLHLQVNRMGRLLTLTATLGRAPTNTWRLRVRPDATPAQKTHLRAWLHTPFDAAPQP